VSISPQSNKSPIVTAGPCTCSCLPAPHPSPTLEGVMRNHLPQGNPGDQTWGLARKDAVWGSLKHIMVHVGFSSALQAEEEDDAGLLEQR